MLAACQIVCKKVAEAIVAEHLCLRFSQFLIFFVTIGLWKRKLRPEIEEEVAKHNFMQLSAYSHPPYIPPKSPTQSAGPPPKRINPFFFSINILTIFWHRFWIDFGSFWGAILGSFLAPLEAKMRQVRSKTCLGSL